jgi:hypothetical protein
MAVDQKKSNLARQIALGRWGKPFGASISAKLDEPKEWVDEATHLNDIMPPLLGSKAPDLHWNFVLPIEFSNPKVTTVGVYALFVYAHLKYQQELAEAMEAVRAENAAFAESGQEVEPEAALAFYLDAVRVGRL